jgi:hypothetical protein
MVLSLVLVLCVAALVVGAAVGWSRRRVIVIDPRLARSWYDFGTAAGARCCSALCSVAWRPQPC